MKIFDKARFLFKLHKKEILIALLFIGVGLVALLYSLTLPFTVHDDTYVTLLANKVALDPTWPDRTLLLHLDFKPYLYTNLLAFLVKFFSLFTYKMIIVFFAIFTTSYAAYLALRLLRFSRLVSIVTALVALMPRVEPAGGKFGAFPADDVMGATFALPAMWLLSAWLIRRIHDKKPLWPVLAVAGLCTYIHPSSLLFFSGILLLVAIYSYVINKEYKKGLKDFFYSVLSFLLTSSALLSSVFFTMRTMSLQSPSLVVTGKEYADAVFYRVSYDFFPSNVSYGFQFFIMNLFFLLAALYVFYIIRTKKIDKNGMLYSIVRFSLCIIFISIFLTFTVPYIQLSLTKQFGFPLIFQQTSNFFRSYYLGIFFIWAIFLTFILEKFKDNRKTVATILLIIGMCSSAFGFEWLQFVVGYYGYQREYIPNVLQKKEDRYEDMTQIYPTWCGQLAKIGITRNDLVISDDFSLRYWCESRLYTTQEEGYIYVLSGKSALVQWVKNYQEQQDALNSGNADKLVAFAKKVGARYVFLESAPASMLQELRDKHMLVSSPGDHFFVIKIF
jgi:hypothetical protein